eukprot:33392_1
MGNSNSQSQPLQSEAQEDTAAQNEAKKTNIFSCWTNTKPQPASEPQPQSPAPAQPQSQPPPPQNAVKIIAIDNDGARDSNHDLNSAVVDTADAFLELLQLDTMSQHLQEMRDRRMFLEKAAHDQDLPEEEREIAAWITDTYLSKSPKMNSPQRILENIIHKQQHAQEEGEKEKEKEVKHKFDDLESREVKEIVVLAHKTYDDTICGLLSHINDWNFSVFEFVDRCGNTSLSLLMIAICRWRKITHKLSIDETILINYMNCVDENYLNNPYHNHIHAADVLLNMFYFMKSSVFAQNIDILDSFSILIAASVHDIGHPGHGNSFEINTESELAIRYNDQSVLENMHICLAWKLLNAKDCNILHAMNKAQKKRFRKVLIDSVLATDMSQHSVHSETLEKLIEKYETNSKIEIVSERRTAFSDEFLPIALHTADLGNLCKETKYYSEWVDRLMEEFFNQGDKERELGIEPITFLCDRFKVNIHSGQVGFINFVIRPWFIKFGRLLYEDTHNQLFLALLNDNLVYMQERANQTKDAQEEIKKQEEVFLPVMDNAEDMDMNMDETKDTLHPLPQSKPKIIDIESPDVARTSKSYSIVGMSFPEMKSKLLEWNQQNSNIQNDDVVQPNTN